MGYHFFLIRGRTREGCFRAFRHNNWVGAAVFIGIALDLALGGPAPGAPTLSALVFTGPSLGG